MKKDWIPEVIQKSIRAISEADMLIIGGTSLVVYPAAGFIDYFHGKHLVVINKSETARSVGARSYHCSSDWGNYGCGCCVNSLYINEYR